LSLSQARLGDPHPTSTSGGVLAPHSRPHEGIVYSHEKPHPHGGRRPAAQSHYCMSRSMSRTFSRSLVQVQVPCRRLPGHPQGRFTSSILMILTELSYVSCHFPRPPKPHTPRVPCHLSKSGVSLDSPHPLERPPCRPPSTSASTSASTSISETAGWMGDLPTPAAAPRLPEASLPVHPHLPVSTSKQAGWLTWPEDSSSVTDARPAMLQMTTSPMTKSAIPLVRIALLPLYRITAADATDLAPTADKQPLRVFFLQGSPRRPLLRRSILRRRPARAVSAPTSARCAVYPNF
ncbi:hypothetical protein B0J13DRAFT_634021, partial [Dactylonectria estremocensis]